MALGHFTLVIVLLTTVSPTLTPTSFPSADTLFPTRSPTYVPTQPASNAASPAPTAAPSLSPTTHSGYCMWGEPYSIINGFYHFQGYYNEHKYYMKKESHVTCESWSLYIYNAYASDLKLHSWTISLQLGDTLETGNTLMRCTIEATTPKDCVGSWRGWNGMHPLLFATENVCPSWKCSEVDIPSIAKLDWWHNSCGVTFNKALAPNVWTNEPKRSRYWWFHNVLFMWLCTDYPPIQTCNVTQLEWHSATAFGEAWHELSNGESIKIMFDYPDNDNHTIYCNGPTSHPSQSPTAEPTALSVSPTKQPTSHPTHMPTVTYSYTSYIDLMYGINGLSDNNVQRITDDVINVDENIETVVSDGYLYTLQYIQTYDTITREMFKVMVLNVDDYVSLQQDEVLQFGAQIQCDEYACNALLDVYNNTIFTQFVSKELILYFGDENEDLEFIVISTSDIMSLRKAQIYINFSLILVPLICILMILIVPYVLLAVIAYIMCYVKRPGSDPPRYRSLFMFIVNVAHLYTNIWWMLLLMTETHRLWIAALLVVFGSHVLSIAIGMRYIFKWKKVCDLYLNRERAHIRNYVQQYYMVLIVWNVTTGFYSMLDMICSHLFHLNILSFELHLKDKLRIANIKLVHELILNQMPIFVIQYVCLIDTDTKAMDATIISMSFTTITMIINLCMILSKCCILLQQENDDAAFIDLSLEFVLKHIQKESNIVQQYHIHTHMLLRRSLGLALHVHQKQIYVNRIQKIGEGIQVNARLRSIKTQYAEIVINKLSNEQSTLYSNIKAQCCDHLEMDSEKIYLDIASVDVCAGATTSASRSSVKAAASAFTSKKRESKRNTDLMKQNIDKELTRIRMNSINSVGTLSNEAEKDTTFAE